MVDTLVSSDKDIDPGLAALSKRARVWLLVVACMGVSMAISSMVRVNAALPDIARETSATQSQLTWVVDGYTLVLSCLLLPAGPSETDTEGAEHFSSVWPSSRWPRSQQSSSTNRCS